MWWLYLDESGDLGFDFVNKKPSEYFTICILATSQRSSNLAFKRAVKRTLKNKLNRKSNRTRVIEELKGSATRLEIKKYAWRIFQKYERKDPAWYNIFSEKIQYDEQYL
ncbi:MAG: DUF3800 domain-containing protein [Kiritimatiellae bacterium]|jgi:hypothetical protein|nr:DUF3800 domain-containing protein [Kiritimatiellia bacterium]